MIHVRPMETTDHDAVLTLNAAEVPRLSPLDPPDLRVILARAELALVATADDEFCGLVIAIGPGTDYPSPNYRFFERRGTRHLYIDRVAVTDPARRRGVGSRLYAAVEDRARNTGRVEVTCEVNLRPRNEASLAFHAARGYVEIGQQDVGAHRVALFAKPVTVPDGRR